MNKQNFTVILWVISLIATGLSVWLFSPNWNGVALAVILVAAQAAIMVFLPEHISEAWKGGQVITALVGSFLVASALMFSVVCTASILLDQFGSQKQIDSQRVGLEKLIASKQASADALIRLDRVTKAQPLLNDVAQLRQQLATLPQPTGFYQLANRFAGGAVDTVINVIVFIAAILLDLTALVLSVPVGSKAPLTEKSVKPSRATVSEHVTQAETSGKQYGQQNRVTITERETKTQSTEKQVEFEFDSSPYQAILDGTVPPKVREVQKYYRIKTAVASAILANLATEGLLIRNPSNRYERVGN